MKVCLTKPLCTRFSQCAFVIDENWWSVFEFYNSSVSHACDFKSALSCALCQFEITCLITHWAVIHPALLPIGLNSNFLLSLITTHGDTSTYPGRSRLLLFCWRSYSSLLFSNGGLSSSLHSCWIHLSSKKVRVKLITFCPT